jgi:hypothetical protein
MELPLNSCVVLQNITNNETLNLRLYPPMLLTRKINQSHEKLSSFSTYATEVKLATLKKMDDHTQQR